ncbi:Non-specific lipid-transfer protein 1 [Linum grandiflorum]
MAATKWQICMALMVVMVATSHLADGAVSCGQVASALAPCVPYLQGNGMATPGCCGGVKSLNAAATTTPDRQAACRCLKSTSASIPGINYGNAGSLPGKCGVNVGYPISPSVNCDTGEVRLIERGEPEVLLRYVPS